MFPATILALTKRLTWLEKQFETRLLIPMSIYVEHPFLIPTEMNSKTGEVHQLFPDDESIVDNVVVNVVRTSLRDSDMEVDFDVE